MDAFNPWDLIKAVGRGFRWAFVGRKHRMEDISYKNSTHGTGLEPTRNQITAFNGGNSSFDTPPGPGAPLYVAGGKPRRYQSLSEEEDSDRLLAHAQPNPAVENAYPRPMERLPHHNATGGDIGNMGVYDPRPHQQVLPYPASRRHEDPSQEYGVVNENRRLEEQDTGYHGARGRLTPVPPPDPHPLGPPGRRSHEEWNVWDGARESERDLGGGHGVEDNRF